MKPRTEHLREAGPRPERNSGQGSLTSSDGDFWDDGQERRRLLAELLGTFLLVFVAAGGPVIEAASHEPIGHGAKVVAPALMVMALIYAVGGVSGAHFNPAVTLAFAVRRDFPWSRVPGYLLVQIAGAVGAGLVLRVLFGRVGHLGATLPHSGQSTALVMEAILTATLLVVIVGTASAPRLVGHNAALAVGATIALLGLFASPISGASMNPARSLGPDIAAWSFHGAWIYVLGPLAGALLALPLARALDGPSTPAERAGVSGLPDKRPT
ncbi:MAG: aquaporin [Thermoleophilaceae bacterium]